MRALRMLKRAYAAEDGYTLAELLVVIGLIGVVLAVAWNVNTLVGRASDFNEREAWLSSEVRTPLMFIDKLLMQNSAIEGTSGEYMISFFTDVDLDDVRERNVVKVEGNVLTLTSWKVDGANNNVGSPIREHVFSTHNANKASGVPLFTYLDGDGKKIEDPDKWAGSSRSIRTTIVADYQGQTLSDSRQTFLRNRD